MEEYVPERKVAKLIRQHKARSGITKKEFFTILDKASQPIKKSGKGKS